MAGGARRIFHRLVEPERVEEILARHIGLEPRGVEEALLLEAVGRVLAEDIYSPIDHPPFDRSLVDGYAVRSIDAAGADEIHPVELRIKGYVAAGEHPGVEVGEGEAVEVATGAMIPRGADSVVMEEYTERRGDRVVIYRSPVPGENIEQAGSDVAVGDLVVSEGTLITPQIAGLLAGLGLTRVKVYRRPRIAVFSTGNEVVEPGEELRPGKVYDVNGVLVTAILREAGGEAYFYGRLPDSYDEVYRAIEDALEKHDVVVTSGGTSAGLGDLVYRVFDEIGEPGVVIHGLKIKPGKPTVFAVAGEKLLVGLPGFPMSCYMVADNVLRPIIERMAGLRRRKRHRIVEAVIPYTIRKPRGRTWLLPVSLVEGAGGYAAYPVSMRSGSISPLSKSDGYLILSAARDVYAEGERAPVALFRGPDEIPGLNIIGSNDYLLNRIIGDMGLRGEARIVSVGSMGGWRAVARGEADIAPTHLYDPETGVYNTPFLDKMGLRGKAVILKGYRRRLGIIVARGNPKGIRGVEDFFRKDIVIVNRTRGSGTRVYLDLLIDRIAAEKGIDPEQARRMIKGYTYELKTHTAVAAAIAHGRADAGIGIEVAARLYGLDFIPLTWEDYDFLILRERTEKPLVKAFIDYIGGPRLRALIENTPGYGISGDTGKIIG